MFLKAWLKRVLTNIKLGPGETKHIGGNLRSTSYIYIFFYGGKVD